MYKHTPSITFPLLNVASVAYVGKKTFNLYTFI